MARVSVSFLFFAVVQVVYSQDQAPTNPPAPPPSAITTDRPAFTNASVVVPRGSFQIENGFLETAIQAQRSFDFIETLLRLSLAEKTELRFMLPDRYQNFNGGSGFGCGWSDSILRLKQQLGPVHGFDASLIIAVSFPSGTKAVSSHGYDPQVQLPWSRKISANWSVARMLSVYWPTQGVTRNTTGQSTFLFDRQVTKLWDGFIEYIGEFPQRGGPEHMLNTGMAHKLTPNQQVDLHAGFGLSAASPDHFVGVGYSLLLHGPR